MVHLGQQYEKNIQELFSFFVIVLCFYTAGLWKRKLICFQTALFEFSFLPYEETSIGKWNKKGSVSLMNSKCQLAQTTAAVGRVRNFAC